MSFTLNNADIQTARVSIPGSGIWIVDVSTAEGKVFAAGDAATLVLSDLTMRGTIVTGGEYVGQASYLIVGGFAGWSKVVKRRAYRTDSGVKLSQVAKDLAADAGEQLVLDPGAERPLGYAWERLGGVASSALRDLVGSSWWVAPDGVTHVGPRPATTVSTATKIVLESYDPRIKRATLSTPDDKIASFLPGATFTAENMTGAFKILALEILISPAAVRLEVLG